MHVMGPGGSSRCCQISIMASTVLVVVVVVVIILILLILIIFCHCDLILTSLGLVSRSRWLLYLQKSKRNSQISAILEDALGCLGMLERFLRDS